MSWLRGQRQGAGPRHRGLFQHRRPGVEVDAAGRGGEVCRRRQVPRQEGPGADGHAIRPRLRGAGRLRREGQPDGRGLPRGRELRRPVPDHRLLPLHRPRLSRCTSGSSSRSSRSTPATGRSSATIRGWRPRGETPLKLDSGAPKVELARFMANETRFGILKNVAPARAAELAALAQDQVRRHYALYQQLAAPRRGGNGQAPAAAAGKTPDRRAPMNLETKLSRPEASRPLIVGASPSATTPTSPASSRTPAPRPSSCARFSRSRSTPSSAP